MNQKLVKKTGKNQPFRSFWQLWNMSFGVFGIQFGWTLQMSNTSAIYEYLGANPEQIPLLWLAAPVSGLIVQPIIGYLSDRTWTPLGKRKPYFLGGAIISSLALIIMPNASSLWMAAGLLWVLDTSVNVSMQPFRAFVVDLVDEKQITEGFAMQSFFLGLSSVLAAIAPWGLSHVLEDNINDSGLVPLTVKLSFYLGAVIFLGTILWTAIATKENLPQPELEDNSGDNRGQNILFLVKEMPETMKKLVGVQFFTWLGVFCILLYLPTAIAHSIFGDLAENSALYTKGIEWAGFCIAVYNAACLIFSGILPKIVRTLGRKITHGLCLLCGGCGIVSLFFISDRYLILLPMVGFGIAWASIHSIPYAIVADSIPQKDMGLYMGIFNMFIVIPQIVVALSLGWVMANFFNNNSLLAVVLGGFFLLLAALSTYTVDNFSSVENEKVKFANASLPVHN